MIKLDLIFLVIARLATILLSLEYNYGKVEAKDR